jgi:hypothetical protein
MVDGIRQTGSLAAWGLRGWGAGGRWYFVGGGFGGEFRLLILHKVYARLYSRLWIVVLFDI